MTRRSGIVAGSLLAFMVLSALPAWACSCAPLDPRSALRSADAAFVGTLVSEKTGLLGMGSTTFTFRVEHAVKGRLGPLVDVESSSSGASCGLEVDRGQRMGLLLYGDGDVWMSNLCSQVEPDALLRAAGPLPAPDGSGPVRFVVGGEFGGIRLLALDGKGRTLGYGAGEGSVLRISVCPGSRRMVELVRGNGPDFPLRIAFRDVRTLAVLTETLIDRSVLKGITDAAGIDIIALSCRDPIAREVLAIAIDWPEGSGRGHLLRLQSGRVREAASFAARWGAFAEHVVYLFRGPNPADARELITLDVRTGKESHVAALPPGTWHAAVSPDGRWMAGVVSSAGPKPSKVFMLDLAAELSQPITRALRGPNVNGELRWLDDRRVVFFPGGGDEDSLRVFDTSLRVLSSAAGWSDHRAILVGSVAYGIQDQALVSARVPGGPVEVVRRFDSPSTFTFVYVSGNVRLDAPMPTLVSGREASARVHTGGRGSPDRGGAWLLLVVPLAGLALLLGLRFRRARRSST